MTATTIQADPGVQSSVRVAGPELIVNVFPEGDSCVVHVTGELDLATRNQLFTAATAGDHPAMVIDLAGVTFMDSSGFDSVVASRRVIERDGRTLTIRGATGQPAQLVDLIAELELTTRL